MVLQQVQFFRIDIPGIDGDNVVEVDAHLDHELTKGEESLFVVVAYLADFTLEAQLNMIKMSL